MDEIPARPVSLTLADYTSEQLILPELVGTDAAGVIHELSALLYHTGRVPDLLPFYHAALNSEHLAATVTTLGWALPHATVYSLDQPCFAVGRCPAPVVWTPERHSVRVVFLFAVPETDARAYLGILAAIARLSRDPCLAPGLARASTAAEIFGIMGRFAVLVAAEAGVAPQ